MAKSSIAPANQRLHALDAIRAIALLLGIVLHATMSFQTSLAEVGFPIQDNSPSTTLGFTFFVIHVFRMSTFFLIAGFFAHLTFHRRGAVAFIKDRSRRILLPLLIFWPLCVSTIGAVMVWAVYKLNGGEFPEAEQATPPGYFPLTHLWFLYILLYLYGITLALRGLMASIDKNSHIRTALDEIVARVMHSPFAAVVAAAPIILSLYSVPDWMWWAGIPTPDQSLNPIGQSLFIFLYVFALGWMFERQRDLLLVLKARWPLNLTLGVAAVLGCLSMTGFNLDSAIAPENYTKLVYATSYGIAVIACSFAFIGAGMQFFARENPVMRYLADASYWIYVMHLSLVMVLQTWLMDADLHWSIKFTLINVISFGLLLLSYHALVRSTWIGKLLNGKRLPRELPTTRSLTQTV